MITGNILGFLLELSLDLQIRMEKFQWRNFIHYQLTNV